MNVIGWDRYPLLNQKPCARTWLQIQADLGLRPNTIAAYGHGLEEYLRFLEPRTIDVLAATREHVALYVADLRVRPSPRGGRTNVLTRGVGLANATMQQRLTVLRLFYDYLIEEGLRDVNPVGRGRYTPGKGYGSRADRGLLPRYRKLPWIPTDHQWRAVLEAARKEPLRNRLMLALQYDGALRREELCCLESGDVDPAHRVITVRAETTKNRQGRVVPYSAPAGELYAAYLRERRDGGRLTRGPLFVSASRRNRGAPISIWTWSKVVQQIARRADVLQFTTHTPRHLCLTDLARAGWDLHEIARFAGHRSTDSTLAYIHLSGRELGEKLARTLAQVHGWGAHSTPEPAE
jgi:integrase/recombinase XerD